MTGSFRAGLSMSQAWQANKARKQEARKRQDISGILGDYFQGEDPSLKGAATELTKHGYYDEAYKAAMMSSMLDKKDKISDNDLALAAARGDPIAKRALDIKNQGKKKPSESYVGSPTKHEVSLAFDYIDKYGDENIKKLSKDDQLIFAEHAAANAKEIMKTRKGTGFTDAMKESIDELKTKVRPGEKGFSLLGMEFGGKKSEFSPEMSSDDPFGLL